jgi:hypothetical protein
MKFILSITNLIENFKNNNKNNCIEEIVDIMFLISFISVFNYLTIIKSEQLFFNPCIIVGIQEAL